MFTIFLLTYSLSYSQLIITPGSGNTTLCKGDNDTYTIVNCTTGVFYTWTIDPPNVGSISPVSNCEVSVQWLEGNNPNSYTLTVSGGGSTGSINITVIDIPEPYITSNKLVACMATVLRDDGQGNQIIDDEEGYVNVCENSEVIYTVHSQDVSGLSRQFDWEVFGGFIIAVDNTLLNIPTTTVTGTSIWVTDQSITVQWGITGNGLLKVTETTFYNNPPQCPPKSKIVNLNIIESPVAFFSMDQMLIGPDVCYNICKNHTVSFKDLSIDSYNSPIKSWSWDFGDGSPVNVREDPSHKYITPGIFEVTLTVTNKCNCKSRIKKEICVSDLEAPNIFCPGVTCEGHSEIYHTGANCNPYIWDVAGGTFSVLTNPAYIEVTWDNVSADGFGYISLDGSYCVEVCDVISPVKVPVVLSNGTIEGPTDICVDEYYTYKLPAWPATNFEWELFNNTNGATFYSYLPDDENSYLTEIITGPNQGTFTLRCRYYNTISQPSCVGIAEITVDVKLKPEITGPGEICINTPCTCSVSNPPPTGGTTTWKAKHHTCITVAMYYSSTSSIVFPANVFIVPGTYSIEASNPANFCDPEPYLLEVIDYPPIPTTIYGQDNVCTTYPYSYSTDVIKNSITHWSVTGGIIQGSSIGNSVTVIWNPNSTKTIKAWREWEHIAGCESDVFQKNINHIVVSGTITGDATVCQDQTKNYSLDLGGVTGETYNWKLYVSSGAIVGSISSGQGTKQCGVTFLHLGNTTNVPCTLYCEVTKCGIVEIISLPITISPYTTITSLDIDPQTTTICSGDALTFTANPIGAPANSYIWDFDDGIPNTCTTNVCTYQFNNTTGSVKIFTVSVQVVSDCNNAVSSAVTVDITVNPEPDAFIWPAGDILFCPPMGTYLLSVIHPPGANYTYQWWYNAGNPNDPDLIISGATLDAYTVTSTLPNTNPPPPTSQGEYWCVVTDLNTGCSKRTNATSIFEDPNCPPLICIPEDPAGIDNFTVTLTGCGQVQATCTTLGTIGVNIIDYEWIVHKGAASYTSTGTATQNQSQYYTFNKAGIYTIELEVIYENSVLNGPPCIVTKSESFIVPLVAYMQWDLACNGSNTGYILSLEDNSSVFPTMPITQYQWRKDGNTIGGNSPTHTENVIAGSTYTIELIVSNGISYPCTTSVQVDVPNLPVADFSTATTYGVPYDPYKSCEGREIEFTNNSTPMSNIIFHEWDFDDNTYSHMVSPIKTFDINSSNIDFDVELKVTDKQGCQNTTTQTITVYNNEMTFSLSPYSPDIQDVCHGSLIQDIDYILTIPGTPPYTWQWYMGTDPLIPAYTNQTLSGIQPPESSTYWVKITDANYCYKNINPAPAKVSVKYAPTAIIDGKQDFCFGEEIKLRAVTGYPATPNNLTYQWTCSGTGIGPFNTKEVIFPPLTAGVYTITLVVNDPSIPCSSASAPFTLTVHDLPAKPTIALSVIECYNYELELAGSSTVTPLPEFNWSNGDCGQTTTIYHGGAYRLWITDEHGCRNYEDVDVPLAPNYYFWRFPLGCYYYCPKDLPKKIDGPANIIFEKWKWKINGQVVTNNTFINDVNAGQGTNLVCDPLAIDLPHNGEGPGEYTWKLNNSLCIQESDIMVWDTVDCCEVELQLNDFICFADNLYKFSIYATQNNCATPTFNLAVVDGNGISLTSVTIIQPVPNILPQGILTTIEGEFLLDSPLPAKVTFVIKVNCYPYPCTGKLTEDLPLCDTKSCPCLNMLTEIKKKNN